MTLETFSFERVEKAVEFLTDSAREYAEARGRRIWLEEKRKVVKAMNFEAERGNGGVAEREAKAYCAPEYMALLDELRDAVMDEERLRALRVAAEAKIEVWRSLESTRRAANV